MSAWIRNVLRIELDKLDTDDADRDLIENEIKTLLKGKKYSEISKLWRDPELIYELRPSLRDVTDNETIQKILRKKLNAMREVQP